MYFHTELASQIWDISKKRIIHIFDGHQQEIYSLDFSLDGRLIVSGSGDKTARIWDMVDRTSKVLTINDADSHNNDAGVTSVAISPNGQLVAAGSLDTVVRIWDVNTGILLERLRGHRDSVYSVAFTPDGKGLVSGSLDKTLKYWDVSALVAGGSKRKDASMNGKKDLEKSSQCTMNFVGHTVRRLSPSQSSVTDLNVPRTTSCLSQSLTMGSGLSQGPKIAACSSGMPTRQSYSVCYRDTRILVSIEHSDHYPVEPKLRRSNIDRSQPRGECVGHW